MICNFFVLQLTIAVMLNKYEEVLNQEQHSNFKIELIQYGQKINLPLELVEFIVEHNNVGVSKNRKTKGLFKYYSKKILENFSFSSKSLPLYLDSYHEHTIVKLALRIVCSPLVNTMLTLMIIINSVTLAMSKYPPMDSEEAQVFTNLNYLFTAVFSIEIVLKLVGHGIKGFIAEGFNVFDFIIVLISILEISLSSQSSSISSLRTFRLLRILNILKIESLKILIDSVAFTLSTIINYIILLLIFIYVYALLGMQFFAGNLRFDPVTELYDSTQVDNVPRSNFDNILWSCVTVFQIIFQYDWNYVMYDCMRAVGPITSLYFFTLILFGSIIMLNLFLAIILGNFEIARKYNIKKNIFDDFQSQMKRKKTLEQVIDYVLGDLSIYVKQRVIKDQNVLAVIYSNSPEKEAQIINEDYKMGLHRLGELKNHMSETGQAHRHKDQQRNGINDSLQKGKDQNNDDYEDSYERSEQLYDSLGDEEDEDEEDEENNHHHGHFHAQSDIKRKVSLRKSKIKRNTKTIRESHIGDIGSLQQNSLYMKQRSLVKELNQQRSFQQSRVSLTLNENFSTKRFNNQLADQPLSPGFQSQDSFKSQKISQITWFECIKDHLINSSLFIFHKDWKIRKAFMLLVIKQESIKDKAIDDQHKNPFSSEQIQEIQLRKRNSSIKSESRKTYFDKEKALEKRNKFKKDSPQHFENVILLIIILSSITLAIDNPLDNPDSIKKTIINRLDSIFTFVFLVEAIIKIIAMGFIQNNLKNVTPYIRSYWNILDLLVVSTSLIDFLISQTSYNQGVKLKSLKSLRALRALRPLRMISRNEGLRLVVNALIDSISNLINVVIVSSIFLMIFAIMGNSFFAGKFYSCTLFDTSQVVTKFDCLNLGGDWENQLQNFDNFFAAMQTLFEMMTLQGWLDVMHYGIDATQIDYQPVKNNHSYFILFFLTFMIIGALFMVNLFAGVIIDNFNRIKEKNQLGGQQATDGQQIWINIQRLIMSKKLKHKEVIPSGHCRYFFYKLVNNVLFDYFITTAICLNTITMAMRYETMTSQYSSMIDILNYIFALIFNVECLFKILGLGRKYFQKKWNQFDIMIIIGTDIGIIIDLFSTKLVVSTTAIVIRGFRIMKIFSIIKSAKNIQIILDTLFNILPQISNIMLLLFLLLFIYGSLGINLFSGVIYQENYTEYANFRSFTSALQLLIICLTQGNWNQIMADLTISQNNYQGITCIPNQSYASQQQIGIIGCGTNIAYPYFISFMIVVTLIVMNLSIATVIEGLETARKENLGIVLSSDIDKLIDLWMEYDPMATGWISADDLVFYLYDLPPPFQINEAKNRLIQQQNGGSDQLILDILRRNQNSMEKLLQKYVFKKDNSMYIPIAEVIQVFESFNFPIYKNDKVHFKDVILKVISRIIEDSNLDYKLSGAGKKRMYRHWKKRFAALKKIKKKPQMSVTAYFAGTIIWKRFKSLQQNQSQRKRAGRKRKLKTQISNEEHSSSKQNQLHKLGTTKSIFISKTSLVIEDDVLNKVSEKYSSPPQKSPPQLYKTRSQLPDNNSYNWLNNIEAWTQDQEEVNKYKFFGHQSIPLDISQLRSSSKQERRLRIIEELTSEQVDHQFSERTEESKYETVDDDQSRRQRQNFFIIPRKHKIEDIIGITSIHNNSSEIQNETEHRQAKKEDDIQEGTTDDQNQKSEDQSDSSISGRKDQQNESSSSEDSGNEQKRKVIENAE